jgi:hypothetical protein
MTFDPLIAKLVSDLKPSRVMTLRQLSMGILLCFAGALAVLMLVMGLRPDYQAAIQSGAMFWKPGLFALSAISALLVLYASSLPGRTGRIIYFIPGLIALLFFALLIGQSILYFDIEQVTAALTDKRAPFCLVIVTLLGGIILAALWRIWLMKSAPINAIWTGALAGACSGFIAASAYAFHCGQDHPFYLIIYYGLPIAVLSAMGGWLGQRYLKW